MALTKKKQTENGLGWQSDPRLLQGQEKLLQIEAKLMSASRAASESEQGWYDAREQYEEALLHEQLETATKEDVAKAKAVAERALADYERAKEGVAPLIRARDLLQRELEPLVAQAKAGALERITHAAAETLTQMLPLVEQMGVLNETLFELHQRSQACVPPDHPWAALPDLSWKDLRFNENHDHGGKLGHWKARVNAFLTTGSAEIVPPPAEGRTTGESEAERTARRQRAAELSKGRR